MGGRGLDQDERIVSVHGLRDYRNMADHLRDAHRDSDKFKKDRAEDHTTKQDSAQMTNAYSP